MFHGAADSSQRNFALRLESGHKTIVSAVADLTYNYCRDFMRD
jgi:hypothetical protein